MIPDPGSQKRITLSLESISTMPSQDRVSDVKIPEWGKHCSNRGMPCLSSLFGTFRKTGDQPNMNPCAVCRCTVDIFSNITDREIQWPGMLVARKFGQVGLVGLTNHWHNRRSSRKLMLCIPPQITSVHLAVCSATFQVCKAHPFKIEVSLMWEMCQIELYTFGNIPVV